MMLSRTSLVALVATAAIGTALPKVHYEIPASMTQILAQDTSCALPDNFTVSYFLAWAPDQSSGNPNSPVVLFAFTDPSTNIDTNCMYNSSSVNVGPEGLTPRFACDNQLVQFIWDAEQDTLTLVEKACTNSGMEASGALSLTLLCGPTTADSAEGKGTFCYSQEEQVDGDFTSMQPTPPS